MHSFSVQSNTEKVQDIPNVDGCIFLDNVEKRSERVFIQSLGRVLRLDKDNKKKYGLIIDLRAKSIVEVCNRVQYYLKLENIFPWTYNINGHKIDNIKYYKNKLFMTDKSTCSINCGGNASDSGDNASDSGGNADIKQDEVFTKSQIKSYFIRTIPDEPKYVNRLDYELDLIISKKVFGNLLRAVEILNMTTNIPHITRGSCGSSLVCYLLGISHVDPIKHNISFARFINRYRDTLPDVDFDFPHYLRDEVFLKLYLRWGNKIAKLVIIIIIMKNRH